MSNNAKKNEKVEDPNQVVHLWVKNWPHLKKEPLCRIDRKARNLPMPEYHKRVPMSETREMCPWCLDAKATRQRPKQQAQPTSLTFKVGPEEQCEWYWHSQTNNRCTLPLNHEGEHEYPQGKYEPDYE